MATAKFNWMNKKGEVYELIVDELGNPVNFTLTSGNDVVMNDANQKPIEILNPISYEDEGILGADAQTFDPVEQPVAQTETVEQPKPKKRGRPKKQS